MKHLFIILSILLLSSFLISCDKKEETLYQWETSSGYEWKTIGDKKNNPQYKGEVKREYIIFGDYIREGVGSLTYSDGDKYEGKWKDGQKHGQGTFTLSDGRKYVGEYKDGIPNGQGTHTFGKGDFEGDKYEGEYKDGKPNGQGTYTSSNGEKYEWEWKDEKPWNGTYYDKDGNIKGKFVNGKEIHQ